MKKTFYKTDGDDIDETCLDPCKFIKPTVKIGSATCQKCPNCIGWDSEEKWVKCVKYGTEKVPVNICKIGDLWYEKVPLSLLVEKGLSKCEHCSITLHSYDCITNGCEGVNFKLLNEQPK